MSGSFDFHSLVRQSLGHSVEPEVSQPAKGNSDPTPFRLAAEIRTLPGPVVSAIAPAKAAPLQRSPVRLSLRTGDGEVIVADEQGRCGVDRKGPPYMWTRVGWKEWVYAKDLPPP